MKCVKDFFYALIFGNFAPAGPTPTHPPKPPPTMPPIAFTSTSAYMGTDCWIMANIIQLTTISFCRRFLNRSNDPCGRLFDQMTQAARSCTANIAEGSSRQQTSSETPMKLLDVARASLNELSGDYMFFLLDRGQASWPFDSDNAQALRSFKLDTTAYGRDFIGDAMRHIMAQRARLSRWLDSDDPSMVANAMLILCGRVMAMLRGQIDRCFNDFSDHGGFTERLTKVRMEARQRAATNKGNPSCPKCGAPMTRRYIRKGVRQGNTFWGCTEYPRCNGAREIDQTP